MSSSDKYEDSDIAVDAEMYRKHVARCFASTNELDFTAMRTLLVTCAGKKNVAQFIKTHAESEAPEKSLVNDLCGVTRTTLPAKGTIQMLWCKEN